MFNFCLSLHFSANTVLLALIAAKYDIETDAGRDFAKAQIHYMLGDNPRSGSYVVGFGENAPKRPHHASS